MPRAQKPEAGRLVRIALAGFVSGVVIPYLLLLVLDMSLLVLGLWQVWMGPAKLGAPQGQSITGALCLALAHSLATVLKHFWSFRWVGIAMGSVGVLAAVVGHYAARAGRGTRGTTFLTILALSAFATNGAALLFQERRSALAAAERIILVYYQLGESYGALLILGTTVGFLLAALIWELWRIIYEQLTSWWELPSYSPPIPCESSSQGLTEEWHTYQDRIRQLKREAAQPHLGPPEFQRAPAVKYPSQGQWWPFVPALLVGVLLWMPLQRAYLRVAPAVTSEIVYLHPDQPTHLVLLSIGSEPRSITFSSSTGQGIVDFGLENGEGRVLRELKGFQLMDLPGIAYNTATMLIADLSPGTYTLRLALRPMEEGTVRESVVGRCGGVIGWGLLQGGGSWFRVLAILMAGLTTFILINACVILTRGGSWFRYRYF